MKSAKELTAMEEYATKKELQEHTSAIIEAMNSMFDTLSRKIEESADQTERRIRVYLEAVMQPQINAQGEKLDALYNKVDAMEGNIAHMTERIESIDIRLTAVESDVRELKDGMKEANGRLDNLEKYQVETNERLDSLEKGQAETNERLDSLEKGQAETNQRLENLENGQEEIKSAVARHDDEIYTLRRVK
ncbi:MAG: hypothetical protein IKQ41_07905 [Clostridia bacterium]|nr:hypothetical protein [Clostridia bacterium]